MLGLKDKCIHPTSQKPYIKSFTGGKDNSPEGLQVRDPKNVALQLSTCLGYLPNLLTLRTERDAVRVRCRVRKSRR